MQELDKQQQKSEKAKQQRRRSQKWPAERSSSLSKVNEKKYGRG
jgi:hypothetical protein